MSRYKHAQQVDRFRLRTHEAQRLFFMTETALNQGLARVRQALADEREAERMREHWRRHPLPQHILDAIAETDAEWKAIPTDPACPPGLGGLRLEPRR